MLKMSSISYIEEGDSIYIVGEPALNIANMLKREARRPLSKGIIAAGELDAEKILLILLKNILGEPAVDNEVVYYSIPGNPIDRDMNTVYHERMFQKLIESLGYRAHQLDDADKSTAMNEAAAIVYANCESEQFTALSSSFGAGMVNTSLLFQTMIGMSFSLSSSGDWIDQNAGNAVGSTATRMMAIKERGVDLMNPAEGDPKQVRQREAIVVYYRNLINRVVTAIKREFKKDQSTIELPDQIPWVLSGGTTKAKNFLEFFNQEFAKVRDDFPISISEVRMARDPMNDVAKGLLIAAIND
jgi:actin-like ATPase involved in cell morphogenesis